MEFRSIFISNYAQLSIRREQLAIRQAQEVTIPMEDITSLMLESQTVTISTAALQKLADYGVTVYICDEKHMVWQSNKRFRMISAVGRMTESFSRVIAGEAKHLELPELLPLESYQYE